MDSGVIYLFSKGINHIFQELGEIGSKPNWLINNNKRCCIIDNVILLN